MSRKEAMWSPFGVTTSDEEMNWRKDMINL
jgi:hypothetical protein